MESPVFPLFVVLLFFLPNLALCTFRSGLLPIVDDRGGNASTRFKTYIVHVQKPKGFKFLRFRDRKDWYMSFLPNTTLDSGEPRMIYAYRHVASGFAARLAKEEVEAMESMDGFVLAYPEKELAAQTTSSPAFLGLSQWDGLWLDSSFGQGVTIGVIDTGVKPTHPSFRERDMPPPPIKWRGNCYWGQPICNNKLIGAMAFKSGRNPDPEDTDGHGTHTASTAAGNFVDDAHVLGQARGTASGTAPRAHLAIYKVLFKPPGRPSTGSDSDILKGIDQAIRDHVDILSMSLGARGQTLHQSSIAIASFAAVTKGIVPCAAAGNEGPFQSIIMNDAPWILTVGASTTDRRIRATVELGNGVELFGESGYQPEASNASSQLPLVYPGVLGTKETLLCLRGSLASSAVRGKIVLCGRGEIDDVEKGEIVKKAGGAGMILMNQAVQGNTTFADPHVLPVAHVTHEDALKILAYFNSARNATAAIRFDGTVFGVRPTPAVASFSSRGPSLENKNIIKPDVVAPGVNILAAWPFEVGLNRTNTTRTFKFSSGTSMATPHVSGIVALLKNNHPNWSPAAIKSAIMTSAYVWDTDGNPIPDQYKGTAAGVFVKGSGHVDPVQANDPGLIYDIVPHDYIRYLCGSGFTDRQVTAIVRGPIQCSQIRGIGAQELNYPSIAVYLSSASTSITVTRTVTNVGDADSTYTVHFEEPQDVRVDVVPDTLQFTQVDEKQSFRVTLSFVGGTVPAAGQVAEGHLAWVASGKYYVRSPIAVTFE